jgi:hypothetical protein
MLASNSCTRPPLEGRHAMTIEQICQTMEQNRRAFDWNAAQIQLNDLHTGERRQRLADAWIEAMQVHYELLWEYLQLRELTLMYDARACAQLNASQLCAPRRPVELPESLSRYVTTAQHAELLI